MNCRHYQLQITLQSYGEIDGAGRKELERHLNECGDCAAVRNGQLELDRILADEDVESFPPDLLTASRRSLDDALDHIEIRRSWWRMPAFSFKFTPMRLLESAALVAMGLALGVFVGRQGADAPNAPDSNPARVSLSTIPDNATLNYRIVRPVSSGMVELVGEVVQPLRQKGNIDDREMRQLLLGALQDASNPGARLGALEVLSRKSSDLAVQEGLIHALTHDPVAGVRMKALESLKAVADREAVQHALVYVLQFDDVPGIRAGAIEALTGVSQAEDVAKSIEEIGREDDNAYVRMMSQAAGTRFAGSKK
jgi:hypothetical protein